MSSALAPMYFDSSSSDDDYDVAAVTTLAEIDSNRHRKCQKVVKRNKIAGNEKLIAMYFAPNPVFNAASFQR